MQVLQLIQKSSRTKPAIYRFGSSEILCLYHDALNTIEICDLHGRHIRSLTPQDLINMGYSPAKLIDNNVSDQFVDDYSEPASVKVKKTAKGAGMALIAGLAIGFFSNMTGCTEYVLKQADKDISTTTIAPVENMQSRLEFKAAEQHANEFLSKHNRKAGQ